MDEGNFHWPRHYFITIVYTHVHTHAAHAYTHSPRLYFVTIRIKHRVLNQNQITLHLYTCHTQAYTHTCTHTHWLKYSPVSICTSTHRHSLSDVKGAWTLMVGSNKVKFAAYTRVQGHTEEVYVYTPSNIMREMSFSRCYIRTAGLCCINVV